MANKTRKNRAEVLPWLSANADCSEKGGFVQVGNSLLISQAWRGLSYSSRILYISMADSARGQRQFQFPRATIEKRYGIPWRTALNGIDELIGSGFIRLVSGGKTTREPNIYEFVFDWKG